MPNYDVLESKESYLGTRIRSQLPNKAYREGLDKIDWSVKLEIKQEMDEMAEIIEQKNKLSEK